MQLPHCLCETPMFMPVGTRGSVKGLTSRQLSDIGCQVCLGNTYHLQNRPGSETVATLGGLHQFIDWSGGLLTDSGGFQMVSLLKLAKIDEQGVEFESPVTSDRMLLTPEDSIGIQNRLGADIIMALDDVVPASATDHARFVEATDRTTRWLDRCLAVHDRIDSQSLFPIVQGGVDHDLRKRSLRDLIKRDCPGYAIGGLAGGEEKNDFWKVVNLCTSHLPKNRPRYVMGIGYPLDLVVCSALGADMYDSVYPSRTARFGVALTSHGTLRIKNAKFSEDDRPIDEECDCMVCRDYTRSTIHSLMVSGTVVGCRLMTYHNIAYLMKLMKDIRNSIKQQQFPQFVKRFLSQQYSCKHEIPKWALDALEASGIGLTLNDLDWN
eukprot:g211.t1